MAEEGFKRKIAAILCADGCDCPYKVVNIHA